MNNKPIKQNLCNECGGRGLIGNIFNTVSCPFCNGSEVEPINQEQEPDPFGFQNLVYWLDMKFKRHGELEDKYASDMLQQQQAEIEKWKDVIVKQQGYVCNLHAEIEDLKKENEKLHDRCAFALDELNKEIEALKAVLIKSKELLEQGEEVDFDDMMHIEILLEDACEVRELIEKTLNGKNMNKKPIQQRSKHEPI